MDIGLRKHLAYVIYYPCTSCVSSINYYLVCNLPIHKICALCGIFSMMPVLLTTENSDDEFYSEKLKKSILSHTLGDLG